MADVGMTEFNNRIKFVDELIAYWEEQKNVTLVEKIEVDDWDDVQINLQIEHESDEPVCADTEIPLVQPINI